MKRYCIMFASQLVLLTLIVNVAFAGKAPTWDSCECEWETWKAWTACSASCGGGIRQRDRRVWHRDIPRCDGFDKCASGDMGHERQSCNTNCENGGKYVSLFDVFGHCQCLKGNRGSCCEQIVTCGEPSSINHGTFTGASFTYNNRVTYQCDPDYNMTDVSDAVRTCTENGVWSGRSPVCMFAKSCSSNPCINKATCVNLLGDFKCVCQEGWTGKICDSDIQPPVITGCPTNRTILTSNMTSKQTWNEPSITDPHGFDVKVTRNYPTSTYEFPWGEFVVQYSAVKPSNGLTADCVFWVAVKPHPCKPLVAPEHGVVICNGWRRDYARVCTYVCLNGFALPPGFTGTMFTCGATGNWLPSGHLEKCIPDVFDMHDKNESNDKMGAVTTCDTPDDRTNIAHYYIETLRSSEFNGLCMNHIDKCKATNVDIKCID